MNISEIANRKVDKNELWYALKTKSRHEIKVYERLIQKGINCYLPMYTTMRQWSDRKKKVNLPLFSCYLFVKISLRDRLEVIRTDGAVNIVSFNNVPAPIPEDQIDSVKRILGANIGIKKENYLVEGQKVEIVYGPLKGITGIVKTIKDKSRLIITIDALYQAVSVEIDDEALKPAGSV